MGCMRYPSGIVTPRLESLSDQRSRDREAKWSRNKAKCTGRVTRGGVPRHVTSHKHGHVMRQGEVQGYAGSRDSSSRDPLSSHSVSHRSASCARQLPWRLVKPEGLRSLTQMQQRSCADKIAHSKRSYPPSPSYPRHPCLRRLTFGRLVHTHTRPSVAITAPCVTWPAAI